MSGVHPFDLQGRAELAIAGLTGLVDPEREGLMYFLANWRAKPPRADHGLWDCGDGSGRHVDALTLARTMVRAGSSAASPETADQELEAWMVRFLGEDGLSWLPREEWAAPWGEKLLLAGGPPSAQYAELSWAQRGTLMGLTSRFLRTGDEACLSAACGIVDALRRIACRHDDGLYFPEGYYRSDGWRTDTPQLTPGIAEVNAVTIAPLVRLYEASGHQPALSLAEGLARFALKHTPGYASDGSLDGRDLELLRHFHTRSCFALGILKLGLALDRREYVAWARQSYHSAKAWGTEFGFFPEGLGTPHAEICCTTDMIEIALLLARHVDRRYYADAERYGRNHLLASQFLSEARLQEALGRLPLDDTAPPWEGRYSTSERVAERQVGGFASRPTLRDAFHVDTCWLMQCCNAAGTRALYDLWRYAVEDEGQDREQPLVSIHLHFSVETPAVRVVSYEPAEGRVAITARQDGEIALRLPEGERDGWVAFEPPRSPRPLSSTSDGYVRFHLAAGQCAEVHYRLVERTAWYEVGVAPHTDRCAGHWRGETLIAVEPEGEFLPLYTGRGDLPPVEPALPARTPISSL